MDTATPQYVQAWEALTLSRALCVIASGQQVVSKVTASQKGGWWEWPRAAEAHTSGACRSHTEQHTR